MKTRTVLALFVLACVIGSYILLVERDLEVGDTAAVRGRPALRMVPERVDYLLVKTEQVSVELAREREGWFLTAPLRARADAGKVERILGTLADLRVLETIDAQEREARGLSWKDYGLWRPQARIGLGDARSRQMVLLGAVSPLGDSLYMRVDRSESVTATTTNVLGIVPAGPEELRDRRILYAEKAHVNRLEIQGPAGLLELARAQDAWFIRKPIRARADKAKVLALLDGVLGLRAERFLPAIVAASLDEEGVDYRLAVWTEGDETGARILVREAAEAGPDEMYAKGDDAASMYAVSRASVRILNARASELRDRALFALQPADVTIVQLKRGERKLEMRRQPAGKWAISEPAQWEAEEALVEAWLGRLMGLQVAGFVDDPGTNYAAYGLAEPLAAIRLARDPAGADPAMVGDVRVLEVGRPPGAEPEVFARFEQEPFVLKLGGDILDLVSQDPLAFRDRTVLKLDPAGVLRITLARQGEEQTVEKQEGGGWRAAAADAVAATGAVERVLKTIAALDAVRFEPAALAATNLTFGLEDPSRLALTFGLSGAEGIQKTLLIGNPARDGRYALIRGQDVVFVIEEETARALTQDLLGPRAP